MTGWSPRRLYEAGLAHVPGDRHRWAMIMSFPVEDNLVLTNYYKAPFARGFVRQEEAIDAWATDLIARFDIRTPSATVAADTLSGGNQQKAVVAREFSCKPKLLVLDQPTRGLDVGSIEFIHRQAIEMRDAGAAILLVSAELDEILELSDRIAVMYRGALVATLDGRTANKEEVGLLMATGGREPEASQVDGMTATGDSPKARFWRRGRFGQVWEIAAVPLASVFLALVVAALIILVSSIVTTGSVDLALPFVAYAALIQGAFGSVTGILNTILQAAPLTLGGLAVGIGFKAGLFNIGGYGQFLLGATAAAGVGAALATAPAPIAITLSLLAGMLAGAAWGWIPGALKAWSGAHEVVTTIMLNSIAAALIGFLILGPLLAPGFSFGRTGDLGNSALPIIVGNIHLGVIFAVLAVPAVWWLLYRSTLGFEIRSVGANPSAARYAGMRPAFLIMLTMSLSGLLSGIAGSTEILGVSRFMIAVIRNLDRVRRHRRRPVGAVASVRDRRGGVAVRRAPGGGRPDAGPGRDPGRDRRRHPGGDPAVPCR